MLAGLLIVVAMSQETVNTQALDGEAAKIAKQVVSGRVQQGCHPQDAFSYTPPRTIVSNFPEEFRQYRKFSFRVRSKPVTEAQSLNGLEWHGDIVMMASVHRWYVGEAVGEPARWFKWQDGRPEGVATIPLRKEGGKWVSDEPSGDVGTKAPSCEQIKALLPGLK